MIKKTGDYSKKTVKITTQEIVENFLTSPDIAKTAIKRLIKKGLIKRKIGVKGWHGFMIFSIENKTLNLTKNLEILNSSSSSNIYNKTTTTDTDESKQHPLYPNWQSLDIEPLVSIGFTVAHLSQIASQNKLQPQLVQDSIYAFAFDLQKNNKAKSIKGDPINFFMGILRNARVYTFPSNYESPQDQALREMLEEKKKQNQKKEAMLNELTDIEFLEWKRSLEKNEVDKIVPEETRQLRIKSAVTSCLKTYFRQKILFPRLEKEGLLE